MTRSIGISLFLLLIAAMPGVAADIDGTWKGTLSGGGPAIFKLKADGATVTGTMLGPDGKDKRIIVGKVKGNEISFSVDLEWEGMPVMLLVKGTISGNEMRLRMDADNGYWGTDAVVTKQ
jgi:hypothetical protein